MTGTDGDKRRNAQTVDQRTLTARNLKEIADVLGKPIGFFFGQEHEGARGNPLHRAIRRRTT